MHKAELTICSVSFHSAPYLTLNWELTRRLNGGMDGWCWLVAENTSEGAVNRLSLADDRFVVQPGVTELHVVGKYQGSYHHGQALNKIFSCVQTRFVLILDPDFFILREGWTSLIIDHMQSNNLAFFGAPWHPRWYRKYRYFPSVHCMFIDLEKVDRSSINFMPDLLNNPKPFISKLWQEHESLLAQGRLGEALWLILRHPLRSLEEDWRQRSLICSSRDTGYLLHQKYGQFSQIKHEEVTAVFRPARDWFMPTGVSAVQRSRLVELWLPDRLRYLPRRCMSFTNAGFEECGETGTVSQTWEQFMWNGQPFGFHVRGSSQYQEQSQTGVTEVIAFLQNLGRLRLSVRAMANSRGSHA